MPDVKDSIGTDWAGRFPIYYGWVILAVGTLGAIMTSPGQTFIVQGFIEHFIRDLGLSRSLVSTLYMVGTLGNAALLQILRVGHRFDRYGPRRMVLVISLAFGATCLFMGAVSGAAMLVIGFAALRFFGQGSLSLLTGTMINQWWVRRRGMMRGLSGAVTSALAMGLLPSLVRMLIGAVGWRYAYAALGGALLVIMAPIGWLTFRRRPEDHGLLPDGDRATEETWGEADRGEVNFTLAEALRTPAFWILAGGIATTSMLGTGLVFHMESIVTDQGLGPAIAAAVFVPMGLVQAILRFPAGVLVDRMPVRYIIALSLVLQAIVMWLATRLASTAAAYVYGGALGFMFVAWGASAAVVWAAYYGREHLGAIAGAGMSIAIVGSSLGPMVMGVARDVMGSYVPLFNLIAFLPLALAIASLFARPPRRIARSS
jgi:sugar phosphate permease